MKRTNGKQLLRVGNVGWLLGLGVLAGSVTVLAQPPQQPRDQLSEPVYRVSKADVDPNMTARQHPLDPALAIARDALRDLRANVRDYKCVMVKRERIGDTLHDYEYMFAKIRSEQVSNGQVVVPFSAYLYFLKPEDMKGREVLYVRGRNEEKMIAHERRDSFKGKFGSLWLRPDGSMAMQGNRYPITEIGLETLVVRLIEKGNRDKQNGLVEECLVEFRKGAKINGRQCTMLEVKHPQPRDYYDFYVARIFIDDEFNVPLRYAAYTWPAQPGAEPGNDELIEEYTYLKLELNVGLTDQDFDPANTEYKF
ncbi:MAG: DUF1571 domain-containing protein [Pirellulaceae bacterium]